MDELIPYLPYILRGLMVTLQVSVLSFALAVVVAFVLGMARGWGPWPARMVAAVIVEVFRGSSALVQLFWAFYVLPQFGVNLPPLTVGILVLGICEGCYASEIVRSGIKSVARGQVEAAQTLGLSPLQTWRSVVLPQALPVLIPPFGNTAIQQVKFTALLSLITVHDLTSRAQDVRYQIGNSVTVFGMVLVVYFAITLLISFGFQRLEAVFHVQGTSRRQPDRPSPWRRARRLLVGNGGVR